MQAMRRRVMVINVPEEDYQDIIELGCVCYIPFGTGSSTHVNKITGVSLQAADGSYYVDSNYPDFTYMNTPSSYSRNTAILPETLFSSITKYTCMLTVRTLSISSGKMLIPAGPDNIGIGIVSTQSFWYGTNGSWTPNKEFKCCWAWSNGSAAQYIDNVFQRNYSISGLFNSSSKLAFGKTINSNSVGVKYYVKDFLLFDRILTDQERTYVYNKYVAV